MFAETSPVASQGCWQFKLGPLGRHKLGCSCGQAQPVHSLHFIVELRLDCQGLCEGVEEALVGFGLCE